MTGGDEGWKEGDAPPSAFDPDPWASATLHWVRADGPSGQWAMGNGKGLRASTEQAPRSRCHGQQVPALGRPATATPTPPSSCGRGTAAVPLGNGTWAPCTPPAPPDFDLGHTVSSAEGLLHKAWQQQKVGLLPEGPPLPGLWQEDELEWAWRGPEAAAPQPGAHAQPAAAGARRCSFCTTRGGVIACYAQLWQTSDPPPFGVTSLPRIAWFSVFAKRGLFFWGF